MTPRLLAPPDVAAADRRLLDSVLAGGRLTIAAASGELRGIAAAVALGSDWFFFASEATLTFDAPEAWAAALARIGTQAVRLHLLASRTLPAAEALQWGLCDALVPAGEDPVECARGWLRGRSELALQSAAALIRRRGGDALERAEFARLFAAREPQRGLAAFLDKKRPEWKTTL